MTGTIVCMGTLFVLALLAICLLAPLFGADSRIRDERDRRAWAPSGRETR